MYAYEVLAGIEYGYPGMLLVSVEAECCFHGSTQIDSSQFEIGD